jgi:hypothetical protein
MTQIYADVKDAALDAYGESTMAALKATKRGELRVIDFYSHMLFQGRAFQITAGTIATGVAMDSVITDAAAEMSVDAPLGTTIIPVAFKVNFDDIATATTVKVFVKGVGAASSAGAAQTPLPLLQGGVAAVATGRVANNGGVTVAADLATTTRRLFGYANVNTETPASATAPAALAGPLASIAASASDLRYVGKGVACVYVQCGATTAFPLYFASLDWIELPSANL